MSSRASLAKRWMTCREKFSWEPAPDKRRGLIMGGGGTLDDDVEGVLVVTVVVIVVWTAEAKEEGTAVVVVVSVVNDEDAAAGSDVGMPLLLLILLLVLVLVLVLMVLVVLVVLLLLPVGLRGTCPTASRAAATASISMALPSSLPSSSPPGIKFGRTNTPLALLAALASREVSIFTYGRPRGAGMGWWQQGQQRRQCRETGTYSGKERGPGSC